MKNNTNITWKRLIALGLYSVCPLVFSGCAVLGFLTSPSAFEERVKPAYDLQSAQERKILIWIECPKSLNTEQLLQEKLLQGLRLYMTEKMEISPEFILRRPVGLKQQVSINPVREARRLGAGYLLLIQVDEYDLTSLQIRKLYSGHLITRSILLDTDTGLAVWPGQPEGKMIHTAMEMEEGRDVVQGKLISGTVHCILRYLYPCEKVQFKHSTERISTQAVFELETY